MSLWTARHYYVMLKIEILHDSIPKLAARGTKWRHAFQVRISIDSTRETDYLHKLVLLLVLHVIE